MMMNHARHAAPTMTRKEAVRNLKDLADQAEERLDSYTDTQKGWMRAVRYAIQEISTWDDPTLANVGLLCGGGILACTGLVCCLCGMAYIFRGDIDSSRALMPYFTRAAFLSILAFLAVRAKKGPKRK